ncbi:MAG TPA: response regulator [Oligoflexus sp.]|uniref:response regulator n=1 Tax=Oligoflexus sp. TaxID=1971216 RepID=UPI002D677A40|nr:response regulator [Oligoflexus sp.]HYX33809.1 response regulator [Oligoflexus sp.]
MDRIDLNLLTLMSSLALRREGARSLAQLFGAKDLLIFDYDGEVQRFLPSSGFPQTIPNGKAWGTFLTACSEKGETRADLPFPPSNQVARLIGRKLDTDLVWVFYADELHIGGHLEDWKLLDTNLAIIFKSERRTRKQESQNQILRELTRDLQAYANALNFAKSDLNKALQETKDARLMAESANATKSAFLANMSHEIRTPLSAMLGFSALLKTTEISVEERNLYVDTINRNGLALTRIIDDILDLAKVEAGKLDVEEVEFSLLELIRESIELFREKAKQKGIHLTFFFDDSAPRWISSDSARLRQIFINIIGNAVKFTSEGGVHVTVRSARTVDNIHNFSVDVKDSGPGLTFEQKDRLFQPFMQADSSTSRNFGGTGLGLVLSQRLAEALGGGITLSEFSPLKGCTFTINFVARAVFRVESLPPAVNKTGIKPHPSRLKGIRVLLVDDSKDNQLLANRILTQSGAIVETADSGLSAITKATEQFFHIILMDIQMPGMDGYEAMKILRSKGFHSPILALTAHAMLDERKKTLEQGFDGHLTKPLNFTELIQTVEDHSVTKKRGKTDDPFNCNHSL